jgi:hypothetical protein
MHVKSTYSGDPGFGNSHGSKDSEEDFRIIVLDGANSTVSQTYTTIQVPSSHKNRNKFSRRVFVKPASKVRQLLIQM